MFDILRQKPRRTLIILLPVLIIAVSYILLIMWLTWQSNDHELGATLDDTWIHVRYASKIAAGDGLQYNDGEFSTGVTSPFWALLLAGTYAVFDPPIFSQVHIAVIFSAIFYVLTTLSIAGYGWWATGKVWIGLATGIATALVGRLVWMGLSGMETMAFSTLSIITIWSHSHDLRENRPFGWRTGILAALATLARPEGYLLFALILLDRFIHPLIPPPAPPPPAPPPSPRLLTSMDDSSKLPRYIPMSTPDPIPSPAPPPPKVSLLSRYWKGLFSYVLLAGSYPFVCWVISGYLLPSTFRAKSNLGHEFPNFSEAFATPRQDYGAIIILLMIIGTLVMLWRYGRKDGLIGALWAHGFVLAVILQGGGVYAINLSRYVAPATPFHLLTAIIALDFLMGKFIAFMTARRGKSPSPIFRLALPILLLSLFMLTILAQGQTYSLRVPNDVRQLRTMHVAAGYWFRIYTEPGELIALNDVGAITHITDRRVMDLEGLVSPDVIDAEEDLPYQPCPHDLQLARLMLKDPPILIGIFHTWYPCLSLWEGALQPFTVFRIEGETVIGGHELLIAFPVWENFPMLKAVPDQAQPIGANFTEGVELAGYHTEMVEEGLKVTLWWQAHAQPAADYHIFVHLLDENGELVGQHDGEPQADRFKMTWWRDGDIIQDVHLIPVENFSEDEAWTLRIGVYDFDSGRRLARTDGSDEEFDTVLIPLNSE